VSENEMAVAALRALRNNGRRNDGRFGWGSLVGDMRTR
jgi:ABC-type sugar transport system substrate-binding protein